MLHQGRKAAISWLECGILGIFTAVLTYLLLKEDLLVILDLYCPQVVKEITVCIVFVFFIRNISFYLTSNVIFVPHLIMCVFPGDDQRGGVALHRHTGPTRQHMRRLLADGLGARGQCYRHGYCRGGTHTHAHIHLCTHGTRRCSPVPAAGTCLSTRDCTEMSHVVILFSLPRREEGPRATVTGPNWAQNTTPPLTANSR